MRACSQQAARSGDMLRIRWRNDPSVHALLIDGDTRCREAWIGERSDGYGQILFHPFGLVVDRSGTVGAKMERDAGAFVTDPHVLG